MNYYPLTCLRELTLLWTTLFPDWASPYLPPLLLLRTFSLVGGTFSPVGPCILRPSLPYISLCACGLLVISSLCSSSPCQRLIPDATLGIYVCVAFYSLVTDCPCAPIRMCVSLCVLCVPCLAFPLPLLLGLCDFATHTTPCSLPLLLCVDRT